jgi:chitin-binding protein
MGNLSMSQERINGDLIMKMKCICSGFIAVYGFSFFTAPVQAHGAVNFPVARQYKCFLDGGWGGDGSLIPNAACKEAKKLSGELAFVQWHQYSANPQDIHDQASVERAVPDGLLCSGGNRSFSGFDAPSADWQRTVVHLDKGHFKLEYYAKRTHDPSFFKVYASRAGYNPALDRLKWSDLEELTLDDPSPPPHDTKPDESGYYTLDVSVPANHLGDAVLYIRWQRDDPGHEAFFNCSDVTFTGSGGIPGFPWYEKDYFVAHGFNPMVGETVLFRVLGDTRSGTEIVTERITITAQNVVGNAWARDLARTLNSKYPAIIAIGVRIGPRALRHRPDL